MDAPTHGALAVIRDRRLPMAEFPFTDALDQFRDEIAGAINNVDQSALASFTSHFQADFAFMLANPKGDAHWRRDRSRLFYMARMLGAFAEFVATAERGIKAVVGETDLRAALTAMRGHCRLPNGELATATRRKYCETVPEW
jgi:hypothetical protein